MTIELKVSGMTCGHCQTAVSKALQSVSGVQSASVDLANGTAKIEGEYLDPIALISAVIDEGYGAGIA